MPTLILTAKDVKELIDMPEVIEVVEKAFADWANGKAAMPPKAYVQVERGDFRAMPAAIPGGAGLKWVNVHPDNPSRNLPTVMAILIYNDPSTGYPLAIMDATELTAYRTGAAAAVASKYLARRDSRTLGLIGAGRQAHTQLMAHLSLFDLQEVRAYDRSPAATDRLIKAFPKTRIRAASLADAAESDIVCTVTPAHEPVLMKEHVRPGTHVNAIGADAAGKEELDPSILNNAVVVVDEIVQASRSGEINVPVSKGLFKVESIFATLGDIVSGKKVFERRPSAVTVFDSTGVAIEDVATAKLIYERARAEERYHAVDMVEA
ncbi:MAG: ornithine cyclodeaminase family protein [Chloroflexi bacterium]|nr:ornithine cyclodeaminase family protein [Chloroflexota bacterium]